MSDLNECTAAVRALVAGSEALKISLGLEPAPTGSDRDCLSALPAVLPLWNEASITVGLLALPQREWRQWPGVLVQDCQAVTIASGPATLFPRFLLLRFLSNLTDEAERLAAGWKTVEAPVHALHEALGGKVDSLAPFVNAISDPAHRARFNYRRDDTEAFEAAHSALARAIDPSETFRNFAEWFDRRLTGDPVPAQPEPYGIWARQALAWSFRSDAATPAGLCAPDALVPLITGHAGWDTALSLRLSWSEPNSGTSDAFASQLASTLQFDARLDEPIDAQLVKAVATGGTSYDGRAHADAVPLLDERGEPVRAWAALNAAAWWMWRSFGSAPDALARGARQLADEHQWADIRALIELNSGTRR
jgi:hypothetical protein